MPWRDSANIVPFTIIDTNGNVVVSIDDTGIRVYSSDGGQIDILPGATVPEVDFVIPGHDGTTFENGAVQAFDDFTTERRPRLHLVSPNQVGKTSATLALVGQGVTDTNRYCEITAETVKVNGVVQGNGFQFASSATTNVTVGAETMVLSAATNFVFRAGRCYEVFLHGRMGTNTAGNLAIFKLKKGTTAGSPTYIDFGGLKCGAVGDLIPVCLSAFISNTTSADITQSVQMSLAANAGTVTWDGGTMPRSFTIRDIGAASDYGTAANAA